MNTAGGIFYKSYDVERNRSYWSFLPTELNLFTFRCGQDITDLLVQTRRSIGILEGMMGYISNAENFLEMIIYKEKLEKFGLLQSKNEEVNKDNL